MTADLAPDVRSELVALRRTLARLEREVGVSPLAAPVQGFGLVNPGEIVAADHMNRATTQGVLQFASEAARDAALPAGSRLAGMIAWTADTKQVRQWDGTAWQYAGGAAWYAELTRASSTPCADGSNVSITWEGIIATPAGGYRAMTWTGSGVTITDPGVYSVVLALTWAAGTHRAKTAITKDGTAQYATDLRGLATVNTNQVVVPGLIPATAGQVISGQVTAFGAAGTVPNARLYVVGPIH